MRFAQFRLPLSIAAGLLTTASFAVEPSIPSQFDSDIYSSFAQADGVPPVPEMPRSGVPNEDVYQYRAAAPQEAAVEEGATRYLETEFLTSRGIETYGWVDVGIGANNWGADWNGPITFNDRSWQGMMNQLYLVNERVLQEDFSIGGRIDLLYGTDFLFTTAAGLDAYRGGYVDPLGLSGPRWYSSKYYGLAMPQLYAEVGSQERNIKFGHFYTLIGYEVVPAIGNFFYTHAYTMQYGEPFTHTGVLGTWNPNDQLSIIGGVTNGWDNWDNGLTSDGSTIINGKENNNAAFLGAVTFSSSDGSQALIIANSSGNEVGSDNGAGGINVGNRSVTSVVYTNEFGPKLTYVYQSDFGYQAYANPTYETRGQQTGSAYWYGVNQYLFWNFTDNLIGGLRFEWFRDNNGTRVASNLRNDVFNDTPTGSGYAGNFWEMTWGLNYLLGSNIVIRPELRYDWFAPDVGSGAGAAGTLPYGRNLDQFGQFYGGCDVIWQF